MFYSKRLYFRPYTKEDDTLLFALFENWKWENIDNTFVADYFEKKLLPDYEKGAGMLATFLKEEDVYIGHCGIKWQEQKEEWYLSFRFLKPFWRDELNVEAIAACVNWGFKQLQINEIVLDLEEKNRGAAKIIEKIGFRERFLFEENGEKLVRYSIFS
jgi:RimJ/RimL family protein N-acetyltransferase